ncbi:hypothetical protein FJQ98_14235 [Lysinibacillus agricola]|uniref:Uncharacterized protein n=1 Tax=Lysinibacillus agricola TaxID=2590012 RepID=A0ABX7ALX7_9BACI|nr:MULTISPECIES: hypothetical protein [Lysinibacillus]QQP10447.1 hypothetical protein FJQ98_14235 [Lysinibacillus agricola]
MKESDLFKPLKKFLLQKMGCQQVYAEVNDIDVVGKHGDVYIGVEMKTSLNFKVIEQAISRKNLVDYVFILVPKPKSLHRQFVLDWIKGLGIGLMYYNANPSTITETRGVNIVYWGKRQRVSKYYHIADCINDEIHLVNVGGSKGGKTLTEYKLTIEKIKECLYSHRAGLTIDELLDKVQTHYASPKPSTMATLRGKWNEEWVEIVTEEDKRLYRMKESYRESYWKKQKERRAEIRVKNREVRKMP